jgi:hypothetical protein
MLRFALTKNAAWLRTFPQLSVSVESNSWRLFHRTARLRSRLKKERTN